MDLFNAYSQARGPAELHIFEAMPHAGFGGGTPEDDDMAVAVQTFLQQVWGDIV